MIDKNKKLTSLIKENNEGATEEEEFLNFVKEISKLQLVTFYKFDKMEDNLRRRFNIKIDKNWN